MNPVFADYGITAADPDALLRQAGCTDTDGDGIYNYTDGTNIVLNLLVPQEDEMKQQAASIVAQSLLGSGIQVQVQALPAEQFQQEVAADRFDLFYGETRMDDAFDLSEMVFSGGSLCYGGGDEQVAQAMTNVKRRPGPGGCRPGAAVPGVQPADAHHSHGLWPGLRGHRQGCDEPGAGRQPGPLLQHSRVGFVADKILRAFSGPM